MLIGLIFAKRSESSLQLLYDGCVISEIETLSNALGIVHFDKHGCFFRLGLIFRENSAYGALSAREQLCFLERYIRWYNEKRIKVSLGAMSPVQYYRQRLGIST